VKGPMMINTLFFAFLAVMLIVSVLYIFEAKEDRKRLSAGSEDQVIS